LTSLEGIEKLVNLERLYCNNNQLISLEGIENLVNLNMLYCNNNQLISLEGIENLVDLTYLECNNNQLTSLKEIENVVNLKILSCNNNKLTSLEGIKNVVNLIKNSKDKKYIINISYNFIKSDSYVELENDYIKFEELFDKLMKCFNQNEINEYIEKIEKMIIELKDFEKYVLK
jgi:Leucine-rich repeat (LRR) protein